MATLAAADDSSICNGGDFGSNEWIYCLCAVNFDLEIGQSIEIIYPSTTQLSDIEKTNICYLAFPDSNSGCLGDSYFHFKFRQTLRRPPVFHKEFTLYNQECPAILQSESAFLWAYAYFRQKKDPSLKRGYFQKSVVLISRLPFHCLFLQMIRIIAPQYFKCGEVGLETAVHDICQWPFPTPGHTFSLPILGTVIQVRIPARSDRVLASQQKSGRAHVVSRSPVNIIMPSLHEIDIYSHLEPVFTHIQLLWELIVTCEPLVIMAQSPPACSSAVQALVSVIWPLRYYPEYRPFFTIHDSEFKEFTTRTQSPPNVMLGVTNPFFAKTLQHWPHILRIADSEASNQIQTGLKKSSSAANLRSGLPSRSGLFSQYKPFLIKDKAILKKLLKGAKGERPNEVQSCILRRFLFELTQSFMIPLERYIGTLLPRNIQPFRAAPLMRDFQINDFLETLKHGGPQITSGIKGDWESLYRRFIQSDNFTGWYNMRRTEINMRLESLHAEALVKEDIQSAVADKTEVERVDMIIKLQRMLSGSKSHQLNLSQDTERQLNSHIDILLKTLPGDLQSLLNR